MSKEKLAVRSFDLSITKRMDEGDSEKSNENLVLDFPFSSEEPYLRSSFFDEPWIEVLGHRESEVDLSRLNGGAPVLLNHGLSKTADAPMLSIGKTTRAWVENGRGHVEVKLSRRDDMKPILQDLQDGLIQNVSVGYKIIERQITKENSNSPDEFRVTKWLPMEVTLADIPADATVGIGRSINSEDVKMANEEVTKESQAGEKDLSARSIEPVKQEPAIDAAKLQDEAIKAERKRMVEIKTIVRSVSLDDSVADDLVERGVSIDDARKEVLSKLAERSKSHDISSKSNIETIQDETETRREMMTAALLHRTNPGAELPDGARQYAGLSLIELARDNLSKRGVNVHGLDRMQIATRAFEGTSDLTNVLANVANKSLRSAYEAAPRTFQPWARQTTAADFKTISRTNLSDAPALETVNENGEFKRGSVTDGKETYQLATVGKIIGFTRQALINDDMSALTRLPAMFSTAAANYESDTVYGILTANAALSDGTALFHANHSNLTGTGTAISVTSLGVARTLMRKQKTPKGAYMNLRPRFLVVPADLETIAAQYVSQQYVAAKSSDFNPFAGALEVISEARLSDSSTTAWYLIADNSQIDTVEYAYLEGSQGPVLETREGFDVDGMEIKVRLDFAAKAIDYRGVYKNNGA